MHLLLSLRHLGAGDAAALLALAIDREQVAVLLVELKGGEYKSEELVMDVGAPG
jgi:hypothetical protein